MIKYYQIVDLQYNYLKQKLNHLSLIENAYQ